MNFRIKKSGFENISLPFSLSSGINKNKMKNLSHKMFNNIYGINKREENIYNYELEQSSDNCNSTNKKIKTKINFENIFDNNNNNFNTIENSFINKLILLKKGKNKFKKKMNEKNKYIDIDIHKNEKDDEILELITEYSNLLSENKKIKKNMILQQILINEMKKDMENLKSEKNIDKNKNLENNEQRTNGDDNYKNILKEKNDLINELKNKNTKITNENQLLKIKINQIIKTNDKTNFIDNLYENILKILKDIENTNKKNNNFLDNELLNHINDDNGNYSTIDKINIINKFIEFAKSEIKNLINNSNNKDNDKNKIFNYNHKIDNSENGKNNIDEKEKVSEKKDSFFNFSNFKLENSSLTKSNNRYIFSNFDLSLDENSNNQNNNEMKLINRNKDRFNLKKHFLEKNGVIFKSNLVSNNKNSLNYSKDNSNIDLNLRIKEFRESINKKDNTISYKNNTKIKIPTPKLQNNKTSNFITPSKLYQKNVNQMKTLPFKYNVNKTIKTKIIKKQLNYSANDKNNKKEKENNEKSNIEYIKTDLDNNNKLNKYDLEYIKLDYIFQNLNNSSILSTKKRISENSIKDLKGEKKENKFNNKDTKINNNGIPKFLKVKNIKEVNGLTKEVMKPSFLKTDISLSIKNKKNNNDKDVEYNIFKDIKKYEIIKNQNNQ